MLNLVWLEKNLKNQGFNVSLETEAAPELLASLETVKGFVDVFAIPQGVRVQKPNGTSKFYRGPVTDAKVAQFIRQVVAANGGRKEC